MSNYFLEGGISTGEQFIIVNKGAGNTAFVVNSYIDGTTSILFLDTNASTSFSTIPIFTASGSLNSITFNGVNLGSLSFGGPINAAVATLSSSPTVMSVVDSQIDDVANWNPPTIFLTGIPYDGIYPIPNATINDIFLSINFGTSNPSGPPNLDGFASLEALYFVPLIYYYNCSSAGNSGSTTVQGAACGAICFEDPNLCNSGDPCFGNFPQTTAWTDLFDCQAGVSYAYCASGKTCSTNCKGPCNVGVTCIFENNGFICPGQKADKRWYEEPWFIIMMIFLVLLIIIAIIFIVIGVHKHHENKNEDDDKDNDETPRKKDGLFAGSIFGSDDS